jgi:hypothetical protein
MVGKKPGELSCSPEFDAGKENKNRFWDQIKAGRLSVKKVPPSKIVKLSRSAKKKKFTPSTHLSIVLFLNTPSNIERMQCVPLSCISNCVAARKARALQLTHKLMCCYGRRPPFSQTVSFISCTIAA